MEPAESRYQRWRAAMSGVLGARRVELGEVYRLQCETVAALARWVRSQGVELELGAGEEGAPATLRRPLADLPFPSCGVQAGPASPAGKVDPRDPDALQRLFLASIPRTLRHKLGAFHTPAWLADLALAQVEREVVLSGRVLDPGCGSGAFLRAVRRRRLDGVDATRGRFVVAGLLRDVRGIDLDPLAVALARLDLLLDLHRRDRLPTADPPTPVAWGDAILGRHHGATRTPRDQTALVGNPPWIPWSALAHGYRDAIRDELAERLQFFDRKGLEARLGHANDDVSAVFLRVTGERYLARDGTLAMVIKRGQLANVSGSGFRRLMLIRPGRGAPALGVTRVVDLSLLGALFEGAQEPAAVLVARAGTRSDFPVAWERWRPGPEAGTPDEWPSLAQAREQCRVELLPASPRSDDPGAPWDVVTPELRATAWLERGGGRSGAPAPLEIRHGLKHDAEGVFALEVLDADGDLLRVRNLARSGRRGLPVVEATIEADRVFPYLKCRHLRAWQVTGHRAVLVPQAAAGGDGERLREVLPRTFAYLERFRAVLEARRSSVFAGGPFYRQFAVGPYTWRRFRVAWCSMAREAAFVVASPPGAGPLAGKPLVLDGACYGVATDDEEEAHYWCAVLGSAVVRAYLEARRGQGKRWLSKTALARLVVPPFDAGDPGASSLAARSRRAHRAAAAGDAEALARAVAEIDAATELHLRRHHT